MKPSSAWPEGECIDGPIRKLKVLDFSRVIAGPYASMHLADLGADVIKVEQPGTGDLAREWGHKFEGAYSATYFESVNHNKRSIELDLNDAEDVLIAQTLAVEADVVIDNFMPGKMERFELDHETLKRKNPYIISASVSGFGENNRYSDRPGFDLLAQAMGGLMSMTGEPNGQPLRSGVAVVDLMAGAFLTSGILAAVAETRSGGHGRRINVALLDTQISMLANAALGWVRGGKNMERFGNRHPNIAPYETLQARDGIMAVAVGTDRQFQKLCEVIGNATLAEDDKFKTNIARINNRDALVVALEQKLITRNREEWLDDLVEAGVPAASVNSVAEALDDPVVRERMVDSSTDLLHIRSPIAVDGLLPDIRSGAPRLGEHNGEVLGHIRQYLSTKGKEGRVTSS